MTKLIFALALFPSLTFAAVKQVSIEYAHFADEEEFCRANLVANTKKEYLACSGLMNGEPIRIYVKTSPLKKSQGLRQYAVSLRKELVGAGGETKTLDSPGIEVLEDEKAAMSVSVNGQKTTHEIKISRR